MIQVFNICLVAWIVSIIHSHFEKQIKNSESVEDAVVIRKEYKKTRVLIIFPFFILNILVIIFLNYIANSVLVDSSHFIIKLLFYKIFNLSPLEIFYTAVLWTIMGYTFGGGFYSFSQFNPVSFLTIQEFFDNIRQRNFSLYLRGFERDSYLARNIEHDEVNCFSEKLFVEQLFPIIPVYAVGMSKELTSPNGSIRIYLSDAHWKTDVLRMMNCAHSIFILVNQKESCIWEIRQSAKMLEKVCFVIDNLSQYNSVRAQIGYEIDFPDIEEGEFNLPFCMRILENYYNENEMSHEPNLALINEFCNNKKGYKKLVQRLFVPLKPNMKHTRNHKQKGYVLFVSESCCMNDGGMSEKKLNNKQMVSCVFNKLSTYVPVMTYDNAVEKGLVSDFSELPNQEKKTIASKIMDNSQCIVLLITNTSECIWELNECMFRKQKMVVIFSDYYICQYLRSRYSNFSELQDIKIDSSSPFYCYYKNDKLVWNIFDKKNVLPMILDIINNKAKNKQIPWTDID